MSGVLIQDECVDKYQELKLGHQHRYVLFKLSDDLREVVVDKVSASGSSFDDFIMELPPNDCKYAVYDFPYQANGEDMNKIVFFLWCPDSAKLRTKMIYTSTKDNIRKKFVGVGTEVQATDKAEISEQSILEKCLRK
ncbi:Cofilin [Dactylellina cionopaga]|nr:Cofilin [Dactylellina cionopaga]